jgi:hypothetical protein
MGRVTYAERMRRQLAVVTGRAEARVEALRSSAAMYGDDMAVVVRACEFHDAHYKTGPRALVALSKLVTKEDGC